MASRRPGFVGPSGLPTPLVGTPETSGAGPVGGARRLIHTSVMRMPTSLRSVVPVAAIGLVADDALRRGRGRQRRARDRLARGGGGVRALGPPGRAQLGPPAGGGDLHRAPTVQPGPTIDGQIVLRGAGRWRAPTGMRSFTYTCNVDVKSSEAVAVVLRDTTPQAAAKAPPPRPPAEPDLSELSPAACESSAVAALKARWPRVSQISFDPRTRVFKQPSPTAPCCTAAARRCRASTRRRGCSASTARSIRATAGCSGSASRAEARGRGAGAAGPGAQSAPNREESRESRP